MEKWGSSKQLPNGALDVFEEFINLEEISRKSPLKISPQEYMVLLQNKRKTTKKVPVHISKKNLLGPVLSTISGGSPSHAPGPKSPHGASSSQGQAFVPHGLPQTLPTGTKTILKPQISEAKHVSPRKPLESKGEISPRLTPTTITKTPAPRNTPPRKFKTPRAQQDKIDDFKTQALLSLRKEFIAKHAEKESQKTPAHTELDASESEKPEIPEVFFTELLDLMNELAGLRTEAEQEMSELEDQDIPDDDEDEDRHDKKNISKFPNLQNMHDEESVYVPQRQPHGELGPLKSTFKEGELEDELEAMAAELKALKNSAKEGLDVVTSAGEEKDEEFADEDEEIEDLEDEEIEEDDDAYEDEEDEIMARLDRLEQEMLC